MDEEIESVGAPEIKDSQTQKGDTDMAENGADEEEEEEEEGDEGDEEIFAIESVVEHEWNGDEYMYRVKWVGYPLEKDFTWEPKAHFAEAMESLNAYWDEHTDGAEPEPPAGAKASAKKRARHSTGNGSAQKKAKPSGDATTATKKGRGQSKKELKTEKLDWGPSNSDWTPPAVGKDTWDDHVVDCTTLEVQDDERYAYLKWVVMDEFGAHRLTKATLKSAHKACPQAMIRFYERHL